MASIITEQDHVVVQHTQWLPNARCTPMLSPTVYGIVQLVHRDKFLGRPSEKFGKARPIDEPLEWLTGFSEVAKIFESTLSREKFILRKHLFNEATRSYEVLQYWREFTVRSS
uniref:Uncharacterized protein n=1 Tax=Paramoeba aestuarina TaxID=180227 RepID=A0A7S4NPB4_9EUKA|mmetsp:Transcript_21306/g.33137  ORF Transcript_21306/g.33137 Transcript_21306/m.33137 type:complete len:113 (+) Transcript_21306:142-480(+)